MSRGGSCHYGPTNTYILTSPLGDMELISCPKGLHGLAHLAVTDANFAPDLRVAVSVKSQLYQDNGYTYKPALLAIAWLEKYFDQCTDHQELRMPPVCQSIVKEGTFTDCVWKTLPDRIPFGKTVSYGQLAQLCGNRKASRAVGQAMKNNPLQLIIPCHRVIQEGGAIGNYAAGKKNSIKVWLLTHERTLDFDSDRGLPP